MPTPQISAQEQLMIELLNRARLDPSGEARRFGMSLNDGLSAGTISSTPKAPLAFDYDLCEAAAGHSSWMIAKDVFSHTGADGSSSNDRMRKAGYDFEGSWKSGENLAFRGVSGTIDTTKSIYEHHKGLFESTSHRQTMYGDYREVGIAQEVGNFNGYNSSLLTQDFARTGNDAFITGVAYSDRDGDRFYDVGEGKSGIKIDWLGNSGGAVSTASAGGYGVGIPTGLGATATVSITAGDVTMQAKLGMTGTNVKLDIINNRILASSTDLALGTNAREGRLLGAANIDLEGNGHYNTLTGNNGSNELRGAKGNDVLHGGRGNDFLFGGSGQDRLSGGSGGDDFIFQLTSDSSPGSRTQDIVVNFIRGQDDIVIAPIDANAGLGGNQVFKLDTNGSFSAGEIRQTVSNGNLLLTFNTDADSTAEMAILLEGITSKLADSDFVL